MARKRRLSIPARSSAPAPIIKRDKDKKHKGLIDTHKKNSMHSKGDVSALTVTTPGMVGGGAAGGSGAVPGGAPS
jgi:hypothetical protein